ncbi:MAG: Rieske 2Fe-2S domain-containing protein [Nocardioides sp.]
MSDTPAVPDDHGDQNLPARLDEPVVNPGLPAHTWRPTDVDPRLEKRAERQIVLLFILSSVCTVLFVVAYITLDIGDNQDLVAGLGASNVALGVTLGGALLLIGIGVIQWARKLMADHEIVEMRHPARSSDEDRKETLDALAQGTEESGIARRPLIRNSLLGAIGLVALPVPVLMLRDLGPTPGQVADDQNYLGAGLEKTVWTEGMRIVRDAIGTPILARDLEIGDLVNAAPAVQFELDEEGEHVLEGVALQVAKSKAALILLRMDPADNKPAEGRDNWTVDGIVAYSKICTHVGCPISLNERTTHHLLCPCHQSTFDLADAGKVIFGPAARSLPQLPIMVDSEGYLVAQRDFEEPVGSSYPERERR